MKTLYTTLVLLLLTVNLWGQVPQQFSYQAVVRDENGQILKNEKISVRITLLKDSTSGETVYQEKHEPSTDTNGLFTIQIGASKLYAGDFSKIDWSTGIYYILSEIDLKGGSNYSIRGTSQLLSVPYALYAGNSAKGEKGDKGDTGLPGNDGKSGSQGDKGDKGDDGLAGNDGKQGPQGDKGDKGDTGLPGNDGQTGPQGEKGDKGDNGLPGNDGQTGPQGDKGDKGDTGLPGNDGKTGAQGDKGDKGDTGLPGNDGKTGAQGDKGDKGDTGLPGNDGKTGAQGEKGDKGDTGVAGNDGQPGPQGEKGDKGDTGIPGNDGQTGPQGDKGDKGDTGVAGNNGQDGPQGEKGDKGDTGLPGNDGQTGPQGDKGDKGDTGIAGNDGQTGPQGDKGDKGDTGPAGNDGKQGAQGDKGDKGDGFKSGTTKNQLLFWDGTEWSLIPPGTHGQTLTVCDGVLTWTSDGECPQKTRPTSGYGQNITDVDGNTYKTVYIGNQQWMAENLKTSKYNDGTVIPNVTDNTEWSNLSTGAWCNYENSDSLGRIYGKLYNWYAVSATSNGNKNVCPSGWHAPTDSEWTVLTDYLGGPDEAGAKMRSTEIKFWDTSTDPSTNSALFSGLAGGMRNNGGSCTDVNQLATWWTYNTIDSVSATFIYLLKGKHGPNSCSTCTNNTPKQTGLSIRCLKD